MSGFVALAGAGGAPADRDLLRRLTDLLAPAGPDGRDTWAEGPAGLGHALLSLSDMPREDERQPASLDGRTWIAADARIDGRPELLRALRSAGRDVAPDAPDAHLILHAHGAWGEGCVERLIGDFAFAIWDTARRTLFCARDHFGLVPLYYAAVPGSGIVAGNVLRSVRAHPGVSAVLDERSVGDFLLFGRNLDPTSTTFADVRLLAPAHTLTWSDGVLRTRRYWEPGAAPAAGRERPRERVERFRALLELAVDDRLRSDRAGTHLSGGLDSTSIAVLAHELLQRRGEGADLRAYTIGSSALAVEEEEGDYARLVAAPIGLPLEHFDADAYLTRPPEAGVAALPPEPGQIPAQSASHEIARRVSAHARQLLAGLGGDPLLGGPIVRPRGGAGWADAVRFGWRATTVAGRLPRIGVRTALRPHLGRSPLPPAFPDWIRPDFAQRADLPARWNELVLDRPVLTSRQAMTHPTWPSIFAEMHPGAHGVPVRVSCPFFDLRLVEFAWSLPAFPWRRDKLVLREAMKGRLPEAVRTRPKTPLFDPRTTDATDDFRYRLALRRATQEQRRRLMTTGPLTEYVDADRALELIEAPVATAMPFFGPCLQLGHWLSHEPGLAEVGGARS